MSKQPHLIPDPLPHPVAVSPTTGSWTVEPSPPLTSEPLRRRVRRWHILLVVLDVPVFGFLGYSGLVLLKSFQAGDAMAASSGLMIPLGLSMSIIWNRLLNRLPLRQYLALQCALSTACLLAMAWSPTAELFLLSLALFAVVRAGITPLTGAIFRRAYPAASRMRTTIAPTLVSTAISVLLLLFVGRALTRDPASYRLYLTACCLASWGMYGTLARMARISGMPANEHAPPLRWTASWLGRIRRALLEPVRDSWRLFQRDRRFLLYQKGFMYYGVGWMTVTGLMPLLAEHALRLNYDEYARAVFPFFHTAFALGTLPTAHLGDRIGVIRMCYWTFLLLSLYPLLLIIAALTGQTEWLSAGSAIFGLAMVGVAFGWAYGPIALAPSDDQAAHYMSVHVTLVAVRGVIGMALVTLGPPLARLLMGYPAHPGLAYVPLLLLVYAGVLNGARYMRAIEG